MAELYFGENRFGDPHAHIERAKLRATSESLNSVSRRRCGSCSGISDRQSKSQSPKFCVLSMFYDRIGATKHVKCCSTLLRMIEEVGSRKTDSNGERLSCWERYQFLFPLILYPQRRALDAIPWVYSHPFARKPPASDLGRYPIPDRCLPIIEASFHLLPKHSLSSRLVSLNVSSPQPRIISCFAVVVDTCPVLFSSILYLILLFCVS